MTDLLTTEAAAARMGMSRKTFMRHVAPRVSYVLIGQRRKYDAADLDEMLYGPPPVVREPNPFNYDVLHMLRRCHNGAKRRGLAFEIDAEFMHAMFRASEGYCQLTGIPFSWEQVSRTWPWQPTVDRIDSSAGYVPGNCRLVCHAVNVALNKWGDDVLIRIAEALVASKEADSDE